MKVRRISLILLPVVAVLFSTLYVVWSLASGTATEFLPTPRPAEPCDLCEPNDSLDQACGPLASGESYDYFIRCTANRDDDFYYVDLETPGTVTLDLTSIPDGTDYSIYLYDENKALKCYSDRRDNRDEHATCRLSQAGRYYIRVFPWKKCHDSDPYRLAVAYPAPSPTPAPTTTPSPPCNLHIDDFDDTNPKNDLGKASGWELDPPGCGTYDVDYTGGELQLDYDLSSGCTARYTTALSLDASPYESLSFEIKNDDRDEIGRTVIGLSDEGHGMGVKVGDFLHHVFTDTWQGGNVPLAAFATTVDTSHLDTLFVQLSEAQGTVYLDSLRLEKPLVPLTLDNFDDLADPNALGGGSSIYKDGDPATALEATYTADGTYDGSPGSYVISYTLPAAGNWALWETYLLGLDVSDYAFLSFYIKGASGGEEVNLYLADGSERSAYVDVEDYAPIATGWTPVRVPLQAFKGVGLTNLTKIKFTFEWSAMSGTIYLDGLRFVADRLLIDDFCDSDDNNSLNGEVGQFTSSPSCAAPIASELVDDTLRLDYDVTAGSGCYCGYWSKTPLDLNPYRTLAVKVRGERCGHAALSSARTVPVSTDKLKLNDYLLDGVTDEWQEVRIPLDASSAVTDWAQGDSYVIAFEAGRGAAEGTTWWDDVAFETSCAPLWVDNFNDEDSYNALIGTWNVFAGQGSEITATPSITAAHGDAGAGLALTYAVPAGDYAGWETGLRNADLSNYDRLVFTVKSAASGGKPNIYLVDRDDERGFINLEDYLTPSTTWQTVIIPLENFGALDMTQIQALQVIIEWEPTDVEGALFLDNIRFTPSASCSQIARHLIYLPLTVKDLTPLSLDPAWDFESGTEGWTTYRTTTTSRATADVETSTFRARWGDASLAMILNLVGSDDRFDRGVAYVDLSQPTDLACKPLSCWIYVPTCGLGDPAEPTSARLFVKDANDKDEYGTLAPVQRNQWYEIELRPSTQQPYKGWMEPGFDPHAIVRLGVQVRTDSQETIYRGKVYVDACGWQEIDPPGTTSAEACLPGEDIDRSPPPASCPEE